MRRALAVWAIVAIAAGTGLIAQERSGVISGYIQDETGGGLPGATVIATSPVQPGTRTAVSDGSGYYFLRALLPGRYQVVAELSGFGTVRRVDVEVNVGSVVKLDIKMNPSAIEEEVVVTAASPVVEPEKTTIDTVISTEILQTMPILGRDFMSSVNLLPGVVNAGGAMSISGGRDTQKNYNIDGMDNIDIAQGKATTGGGYSLPTNKSFMTFDQEAIQELSVARGGYGADKGWGSGGIISVVTKSGSNDIHGSLYLDARNNKWDYDNPVVYESYYFGGSLGGPIIKDKLLYFLTFTPRYGRDGYDTRSYLYAGVPTDLRGRSSSLASFLKLTWRASEQHNLNVSANVYKTTRMRHMTLYREPGDYPEEDNYDKAISVNAGLTSMFSQNFLVDSRFLIATNKNERRNPPGSHAGTIYDYTGPSIIFRGNYGDHDWGKLKINWTETANLFVEDWAGKHTIVTGLEVRYNSQRDQRATTTGETWAATYKAMTITPAYDQTLGQTYYAAFVSDKWSPVKNLVLEPGVRVSNSSYLSDWLFEPRLNVSFDPFSDGRTVFRAGANLYRDRINDYVQQMTNYPLSTRIYDYGLGYLLETAETYRVYDVVPDLTYPTTTELTVGVDREILRNFFASASFIYRKYDDQLFSMYTNLMDPVTGQRADPTRGRLRTMSNTGHCDYKGVQLVLGKRLGRDWFQFLMSFTHQVSNGNSFLFLDFAQHQNIINPEYTNDFQPYELFGKTAFDKPYDFKAYVSARLPLGFMVSGVFNLTAGTPYTEYSRAAQSFVSEYQALRSPDLMNLDLRLEKAFRIRDRLTFRFKLEAFNATNRENIIEVMADVSNAAYGQPYQIGPSRRLQAGLRVEW